MIAIGFDLASSEAALRLSSAEADVWAAVGVHPHDASTYGPEVERRLREMAAHPKVVAIGEIGLDYHYNHSPQPVQRDAFASQLALARDVGLPVVIHCREAHDDLFAEYEQSGLGTPCVMHCWSGSVAQAHRAIEDGMHLGIAGVLTFKKRGELGDVVRAVPEDRLLIETDAPYLAPVPHRGKRNEPAYVSLVCAQLARDRDAAPEHIARVTTSNALRLFSRLRMTA